MERIGGIVWKEVGLALVDVKCWFTAVSKHLDLVGLDNHGSAMIFFSVPVADLVQFMYFSCNVGFSSLPGKRLDLIASD